VLWPIVLSKAARSRLYYGDPTADVGAISMRDRLIRSGVALLWWPVHALWLELGAFTGAWFFGLAGWSPTAGFNLATLISAVVIGFAYAFAVGDA
jgi:hypothetical protein